MSLPSREVCVAAVRVVQALDQSQLFELIQRAVDGDQPETGILLATQVIELEGTQGARAVSEDIDDGAPGSGKAVAVLLEAGRPGFTERGI